MALRDVSWSIQKIRMRLTSYYGLRKHLLASAVFKYADTTYRYTDIETATCSKGPVWNHEGGAPRIAAYALLDTFGEEYVKVDFGALEEKPLVQSCIIKRAFQIEKLDLKCKS